MNKASVLWSIVLLLAVVGCKKDKDTDPEPKVPVLVKIERLEITDWPATAPDGSGWDPFDAPDIYIQVFKDNDLIYMTETKMNYLPGQTIAFNPALTFVPGHIVSVVMMDHDDLDPDDKIGQTGWIAWVTQNGEESTITTSLGDFTVKRIQTYVY